MKSPVADAFSHTGSPVSRRPSVRLLKLAPAAVLLSGLFAVWAGPLAVPATAAAPTQMVVAWGNNAFGQTNVPASLSGVTAIAAGYEHSLALKSDGTVVAWGNNYYGQTTVPAGLSGVTAISGGSEHSLALKSDGTVVAWGLNRFGQIDVPAGLSGVTAIAAGRFHSLALKSDGTVVAWGDNGNGQTTVPAGLSGVSAIAAGGFHSLALKSDRTVVAWGWNGYGQINVPAGLSGVTAIAAGQYDSLALRSDGTVVAWGNAPTVPAVLSGVTAIAADGTFSLALEPARTLTVFDIQSPYSAGVAHSVMVAVKDADGTTDAGYRGTVHFTSTDPAAVLPGDYTFTAVDAGVHVFSITLKTAGSQGVRARDTVATSITGAKYGIVVTGYPVATLALSGSPIAGVAHDFTVTAKDASGHTDAGYRGTMHFTSTDPKAVLPPDYKFTAHDAGVHVFSITFKTVGAQGLRARDTITSTLTGAKYGIVVS